LLREGDGRYATIDRWESGADFRLFKERFAGAYAVLDARCEALTEEETFIGEFEIYGPGV
jgi:hypothetical protein